MPFDWATYDDYGPELMPSTDLSNAADWTADGCTIDDVEGSFTANADSSCTITLNAFNAVGTIGQGWHLFDGVFEVPATNTGLNRINVNVEEQFLDFVSGLHTGDPNAVINEINGLSETCVDIAWKRSDDLGNGRWRLRFAWYNDGATTQSQDFRIENGNGVDAGDKLIVESLSIKRANILGQWDLQDASGTVALNSLYDAAYDKGPDMRPHIEGTYANAPTLHALGPGGVYPHAAKFAEDVSYLEAPIPPITGPFSFSFWCALANFGDQDRIFGLGENVGAGNAFEIKRSAINRINIDDWGGLDGATITDTRIGSGLPFHVAVTYDGTLVKMFLDGVLAATSTEPVNTPNYTGRLRVNSRAFDTPSGMADARYADVRLYSKALSAAEVLAIYEEARGPVLHYDFNDETTATNGTTVVDKSGNNFDGTLSGLVWDNDKVLSASGGNLQNALDFASGDYITLPDDSWAPLVAGDEPPLSLSFWMKCDNTSAWQNILCNEASQTSGAIQVTLYNDELYWRLVDDANAGRIEVRTAVPTSAVWHLMTVTYDGSGTSAGMTVYYDGVAQTPTATADSSYTSLSDPAASLVFGALATRNYVGELDDLRIYYRELTADEVFDLYLAGRGLEAGLIRHYRLNDNLPTPNVVDSSDSGVDATLSSNGTATTANKSRSGPGGELTLAMRFDASENDIALASPLAPADLSAVSFCAYCKSDAGISNREAIKVSNRLELGQDGSSGYVVRLNCEDAVGLDATPPEPADYTVWSHVAGTFDGITLRLYVGGQEAQTFTPTTPRTDLDIINDVQIGAGTWKGELADVRIYNRALLPSEIDAIYQEGVDAGGAQTATLGTIASVTTARTLSVTGTTASSTLAPIAAITTVGSLTASGAAPTASLTAVASTTSVRTPTATGTAASRTLGTVASVSTFDALAGSVAQATTAALASVHSTTTVSALTVAGVAQTRSLQAIASASAVRTPTASGTAASRTLGTVASTTTVRQLPGVLTQPQLSATLGRIVSASIVSALAGSGTAANRTLTPIAAMTTVGSLRSVAGLTSALELVESASAFNVLTLVGLGNSLPPASRRFEAGANARIFTIRR